MHLHLTNKTEQQLLCKYTKLGYPERCHNYCFNFSCFRWHYLMRSSSIYKNIEVIFHLNEIEVVFNSKEYLGWLSLAKQLRSSSIWFFLFFFRSSYISKQCWVIFHILSSWDKIRLHQSINFLGCPELP